MSIIEGRLLRLVVALSVQSSCSADRSIDRTIDSTSRVFSTTQTSSKCDLAQIRSWSLRLASGDLGQQGELTTNTTVIFVFFQVWPGRAFNRDRPGSRDTRITWRMRISPSSARSVAEVTRSSPVCRSIWGTSAAVAGTSAVSYAGAVLRRTSVCAVIWCEEAVCSEDRQVKSSSSRHRRSSILGMADV